MCRITLEEDFKKYSEEEVSFYELKYLIGKKIKENEEMK